MFEASAPASSANLGPGFDAIALALDLRCHVRAEVSDSWSVEHAGDQRPDSDSDDAVLAAAKRAVGEDRPLSLSVVTNIPIGRGLGSSSAALAAGALAAWRALGEEHPMERLFELVAEMEGHPDNAGAAVFGGLVLVDSYGQPHRLPWNPIFAPIILIPHETFATKKARSILPDSYDRDIVIASIARASSLVAGLLSGAPELLRAAGGDEIHEGPRNEVMPAVEDRIRACLAAGAVHAAWSGAGPTVLAIVESYDRDRIGRVLAQKLGDDVEVVCVDVAARGAV